MHKLEKLHINITYMPEPTVGFKLEEKAEKLFETSLPAITYHFFVSIKIIGSNTAMESPTLNN